MDLIRGVNERNVDNNSETISLAESTETVDTPRNCFKVIVVNEKDASIFDAVDLANSADIKQEVVRRYPELKSKKLTYQYYLEYYGKEFCKYKVISERDFLERSIDQDIYKVVVVKSTKKKSTGDLIFWAVVALLVVFFIAAKFAVDMIHVNSNFEQHLDRRTQRNRNNSRILSRSCFFG